MKTRTMLLFLTLMFSPTSPLFADLPRNNSPEELERWFNSNEEEWKPQDINEGALHFLKAAPKIKPHRANNHITITAASTRTGWVSLTQCYTDLDTLPAIQIVYKKQSIKNIRILKAQHIGESWVEDNTVQMKSINTGAEICIQAELHALTRQADHQFTLQTGPYRRKFLDGYFPIDLELTIDYPDNFVLTHTQPMAQAGFAVHNNGKSLAVTALFEGVLAPKFKFSRKSVTNTPL